MQPPPVWNAASCRRGGQVPNFSGQDVIRQLEDDHPQPLFVWLHDAHPGNPDWDYNYGIVYQVQRGGWTIHVIAHQHIKEVRQKGRKIFKIVDGHAYIPGYDNYQANPPSFVFEHVPGYDPAVTQNGWSTDPVAKDAFWNGNTRYPV